MKLTLSTPQMREKWLTIRRLNSAPLAASVTRTDGVDIEQLVDREIMRWYHRLLLNADIRLLSVHEVARKVSVTIRDDGQSGELILPPETVRLISVRADTWDTDGRIINDPTPSVLARQNSPLTASTASAPTVYRFGSRLLLCPFSAADRLVSLQTVELLDDIFEFDSLALSTILPYDTDFSF